MKQIQALRERRAEISRNMLALNDEFKGAKWGAEQQKKWEEMETEEGRIRDEITRMQRLADMDAEKAFGDVTKPNNGKAWKSNDVMSMTAKWAAVGERGMTPEEFDVIRNTMSTTTPGEGGYTVAIEVATMISDSMKDFSGMRKVAEVIRTSKGNPINYPTSDGTAETGEQVDENAPANNLDVSFGVVPLNTFRYSSLVVRMPFELLQDSQVDMEAFVKNRLTQRVARIQNTKFTTGTGVNEPKGVVAASALGKTGAAGQVASIIFDDIVDLEFSVDVAYRDLGRCKYMMNDSSVKVVRKLKDSTGRPIWTPSYDGGIVKGTPDMLNGYPIAVNNAMAAMAANAKSVLFGDIWFYKIRDVLMDVQLFRFTDSVYASKGQVGFLLMARSGGTYTDVGGAVKHYVHPAA
ncbi:MAG: phage major capsid protein [Paludibaculum sp.]